MFSFSENVLTLSYGVGNAQFKNLSGGNTPGPRFRGEVGEVKLHLLVGPPPIALPQGPHQPKSGPGDVVVFETAYNLGSGIHGKLKLDREMCRRPR